MKKYFFFAAAALALASCSSDDFVGTGNTGNNEVDNAAINFNSGTNKVTRADPKTGEEAATDLNNNFVVYGYKTTGGDKSTVYDHYTVTWLGDATKGQTASNKAGWEYVGQTKNELSELPDGATQTIKYWDYSANQYDFVAFSFGKATQGTGDAKVEASKVTTDEGPKYTLKGTVDNLAKCYISDRVSAQPNLTNDKKVTNKLVGYQDPVSFNFRSLKTQVKLAIYEIVPGYSIKDVVYYSDNTTKLSEANNKPTLFANSKSIPAGTGTMTITFGSNESTATDFNQAKVSWQANGENSSTIDWESLGLTTAESKETEGNLYLGRDVTNASKPTDYKTVLPGTEVKELTLKVDYTLVSTDGSGETIKVTGAKATIPNVYTQWKPNYAYTYIFKISDKTNGGTGTGDDDPKGLYPITFDAVVTETETGKQETITEVDEPSITTYAKGEVGKEYNAGSNIYVSVGNNLPLYLTTTTGEGVTTTTKNIALYTVETTGNYAATEANVALALTKTVGTDGSYKLTEGSNTLTVKPVTGLSIVNKIEAADAVDGNAISGNFAKFTPTEEGNYVVEYIDKAGTEDAKKYYKVIIVK